MNILFVAFAGNTRLSAIYYSTGKFIKNQRYKSAKMEHKLLL